MPGVQTQVIGNTIINNTMPAGTGGGISLFQTGNALILKNFIKGNISSGTGGMEIWNYSSETVADNVIIENGSLTNSNGGGVSALYINGMPNQPGMYLTNNTLAGGSQDQVILFLDYFFDSVHLTNNIIVGNGAVAPIYCDPLYGSALPSLENNDVFTPGSTSAYSGICTDQTGINGNLSVDPLFLDPAHSDYHLQARSPLIDAGVNTATALPATDFDGNQRIVDGNNDGVAVVDLGAYEYTPGPPGPYAALSPAAANFPNQDVGNTSAPIVFTLTNTGTADLTISGISVINQSFAGTNNCPATLPIGSSCTISVTFTPTTGGPASGVLYIGNNAPKGVLTASLNGAGNIYAAALSPSSVDFGLVANGSFGQQTLTFSNIGNAPITVNSISVPSPFTIAGTGCGAPAPPYTGVTPGSVIPAGASCAITVQFSPTTSTTYNGAVSITTTAPGTLSTNLTGTGGAAIASVTPATLSFDSQLVGTRSAAQIIDLTNTGNMALSISQIGTAAPFAQTNNCGSSVAPGSSCTLSVTYAPTARGTSSGSLTITDNASGGSTTIALSGTGVAPVMSVSPTNLSFGNQQEGTSSDPQFFTITNSGDAALSITSIIAYSPFNQTNNCPGSLVAGASCTVNVIFAPAVSPIAPTAVNTSISVNVSSPAASQTVTLSGTPLSPIITWWTSNQPANVLAFGDQLVGTQSAAQQVFIKNAGNAPLSVSNFVAPDGYLQNNNCGSPIAAGATCTVNVVFAPTSTGYDDATLTFTQNAPNASSTAGVGMTGRGIAPVANISTTSLTFSNQLVGTTSAAQGVTISDPGTANLSISSVTVTGPFAVLNNCGTSLYQGSSCTLNVTFVPTTRGAATGTLTVVHNAPGSPTTVTLSGTAVAPVLALSASTLNVGSQLVGTTSAAQTISVSNSGDAGLSFNSISVAAPFAQTNDCGTSLAAGATCTMNVTFSPTARGAASANLAINVAAPATSQVSALSGTGIAPLMAVSPATLTFASQLVGSTSAAQSVTISNTGDAALAFNSISVPSPYAQTNTCGTQLASGATCTVNITFAPAARGAASAMLTVNAAAPATAQTVSISATGIAPIASLSSTALSFGGQLLNSTSAVQSLTLTNSGDSVLNVSGISTTGDFAQNNNCGSTVAVGASCAINVTFTPTARGARSGTLTIADDSFAGSQQTVTLSGTGQAALATLSPASLTFAGQTVNTTSALQSVTFANTGDVALTLSSATATGDFNATNNCPSPVPVAGSCSFNVAFTPTASGSRSGTLTANGNFQGSPASISLNGTGVVPGAAFSNSSVSFASQRVGTSSAAVNVTLTNTGAGTLFISGFLISGDFSQANNCGSSLAPSGTCTVSIVFTPTARGTRTGALTLSSNAPGTAPSISLTGTESHLSQPCHRAQLRLAVSG